jgi:predicted permease
MLSRARRTLRAWWQRRRVARELDHELAFHLEMDTHQRINDGVPPDEAYRLARLALGGVEQTKERVRDVRATWVDMMRVDLREAIRSLRRRPTATLAATAMLACAVGLTAATFAIIDALVLRPVPFADPERLAQVYLGNEHGGRLSIDAQVLRAWRTCPAFVGVESADEHVGLVDAGGDLTRRSIGRVTPGIFALLGGVQVVAGRTFDSSDTPSIAVVSERFWRTSLGAERRAIGRVIRVDDAPVEVIGVLPDRFRFPSWETDIWMPVAGETLAGAGTSGSLVAYVRFASGLSRVEAEQLATRAAHIVDPTTRELRLRVRPLAGIVLDPYYARAVPLLTSSILLVFLVLCANASSLLLAQATTREREFAVRAALGASSARLVRQACTESALLGVGGVLGGGLCLWVLLEAARDVIPDAILLRTLHPLGLDSRVGLATVLAGLAAAVASGLLPILRGTRAEPSVSLRLVDRGATLSRPMRRTLRWLLVGELALACTLLITATTLVRSFVNLTRDTRGLDATGVLTAWVILPPKAFATSTARSDATRAIATHLRTLPGVQRAVWSGGVPPAGGAISVGTWQSEVARLTTGVDRYAVGPDFFNLYGIVVLRGRTFSDADPPNAVLVGERLAQGLWPNHDPLGRSFRLENEVFTVVGVTRELHLPTLEAERDRPELFERAFGRGVNAMLSLRCSGTCPSGAMIQRELQVAAPSAEVYNLRVLDDVYAEELASPRATAAFAGLYAVIALGAAAAGLFAALTYAVGRRRREFGIRLAIGATPGAIWRLLLREVSAVVALGITGGVLGAWAMSRALGVLVYGVDTSDAISWTLVIGILALATVAAAWRPSRDAARIDPVTMLRDE